MGGRLPLGGMGKFPGIFWELPLAKGNSVQKGAVCVVSDPPPQQLGVGSTTNQSGASITIATSSMVLLFRDALGFCFA